LEERLLVTKREIIRGNGRVEMYHVIMGYLAAVDIVHGKWLRKRAEVVARNTYRQN
jgi:hypothetical protein